MTISRSKPYEKKLKMRKNGEIEHILKSNMLGKISAGSFQGRIELYKHTKCKQSNKKTCGNSNKTAKVRNTYTQNWD